MGKLENKVCIVTGASGGLGKQTAIRFAEEGAIVCICARTEEALKETERICKEKGADVLAMTADVSGLPGFAAYATEKEAIRGLSRVVAREWGRFNIRVNCLCPKVATDRFLMGIEYSPVEMQEYLKASMTSDVMGRMGMAYEDATPVIAFLVSDEAGWITGQTIHVEGGDWISA